jgi:hypothetical protein
VRWLLTGLGRAPERSELTIDCRQCGRWDRVNVFRLGPRRARYSCRGCGAVIAVPDRAGLRPVTQLLAGSAADRPRRPLAAEPAVRELMPAAMLAWLAAKGRPLLTLDRLDKQTIYQLYRNWDAHLGGLPADRLAALAVDGAPPPQPGLPAFSVVAGAVQNLCYRTEAAVESLVGTDDEGGAAVWQRAEHARRWLALRGREWCWVHSRLPGGQLAEPDRSLVEAATAALRSGAEPSAAQSRAARAALLGTEGGPPLATLQRLYPAEHLLTALDAYLDTEARPLREDVLAHLAAPLRPAGR